MRSFEEALKATSGLTFPVGEDENGSLITGNIEEMTHFVVSGASGMGKSYGVHSMLLALIAQNKPENLRFIIYDYKMVEFSPYQGLPHMLTPVITDIQRLKEALSWAENEIQKRFRTFAETGKKSLHRYNDYEWENFISDNGLPRIIVVIDDLTFALNEDPSIEQQIDQIILKGRQVGVHLVVVSQAPTWKDAKDVVSQVRSRLVFSVSSQAESKFLMGKSHMPKIAPPRRAFFVSNGSQPVIIDTLDIEDADFSRLRELYQGQEAVYDVGLLEAAIRSDMVAPPPIEEEPAFDELLPDAVDIVLEVGQASVSTIQRRLKLGYGRAARLVDQMEEKGIVGPFEGSKPRQVLVTKEQWKEMQYRQGMAEIPAEQEEQKEETPVGPKAEPPFDLGDTPKLGPAPAVEVSPSVPDEPPEKPKINTPETTVIEESTDESSVSEPPKNHKSSIITAILAAFLWVISLFVLLFTFACLIPADETGHVVLKGPHILALFFVPTILTILFCFCVKRAKR